MELVKVANMGPGGDYWKVGNAGPMKRLITACSLLTVLERALLPALLANGTGRVELEALRSYAHKLGMHGAATGGSFKHRARRLSKWLLTHADNASAKPLIKRRGDLTDSINRLINEVRNLQNEEYTISQG